LTERIPEEKVKSSFIVLVSFIALLSFTTSNAAADYAPASPVGPLHPDLKHTNAYQTREKSLIERNAHRLVQLGNETGEAFDPFEDELDEEEEDFFEETETINDPLQPFNRAMFTFNDKLYYWALKPVARGYRFVVPKRARISVRKFFSNLATPVRFVNCFLQGRTKGVGIETARFVVNTTVGIVGFFDPAYSLCKLEKQEADFDQTLGIYKMKQVCYINWPLLGASSVRGTLGFIGDTVFDPVWWLAPLGVKIGLTLHDEVNETSLTIGDYEGLTEPALDPYLALRNAYFQNRQSKLEFK
jgi:phospholipid-binding lipoprotein MlaA